MVELSLRGRIVVVTGAGGGLGSAFCAALARAGAVVAADLDLAAAERSAQVARDAGGEAMAVHVDVSDPAGTLAVPLTPGL